MVTKATGNPNGRPPHQYSEIKAAKIESLLKYGIPRAEIANHVGMSDKTLNKYYGEILENVIPCRDACVKASLFHQATVLNIPASTIFYLKTRCHEEYSEKNTDTSITKEDILKAIADKLPD